MVQEKANEEEWDRFCLKEKSRLAKRQKAWVTWLDSDKEEPLSVETRSPSPESEYQNQGEGEEPERPSILDEQTQTLKTPPAKRTKEDKKKKEKEERVTTEVLARRSQRVRHRTLKGQYVDNEEAERRYRREERVSRSVTTHKKQRTGEDALDKPFGGPQMRNYCAFAVGDSDQEEKRQDEEDWVTGKRRCCRMNLTQGGGWNCWNCKRDKHRDRKHEDLVKNPPNKLENRVSDPVTGRASSRVMQKRLPLTIPPGQEERSIHDIDGPVVPIMPNKDATSGSSEELSIVSPISDLILGYDTEELTDETRNQYLRPRPDSVVIPLGPDWAEHQMHLMQQSHSAVPTLPTALWIARSELPAEVSVPNERLGSTKEPLTDRAPTQTLRRQRGHRNLYEKANEREVDERISSSADENYRQTSQNNTSGEGTSDLPGISDQYIASGIKEKKGNIEMTKITRGNARDKDCQCEGEKRIKAQRKTRKRPHLPSWLWKRLKRVRIFRLFRQTAHALLTLSIALALVATLYQL